MKRAMIIAAVAWWIAGSTAFAQGITVSSPAANATWLKGSSHAIQWTIQNYTPSSVAILLVNPADTTTVLTIAGNAPNPGPYQWNPIPTSVPPGQYKVKVVVMNQWSGLSGQFTIASGGQTGGFHAQPGQVAKAPAVGAIPGVGLAVPLAAIRILEPTRDSQWTVGKPATVRWEAKPEVKFPLWIFLVTADHMPVMDMGKVGSESYRPSQMQWTVTDNVYDAQYCVRITSADNVQYHSQAFKIVATTFRTVTVPASGIANKVHRHNWSEHAAGEFTTAPPAPVPDPGGNVIKYGYQRWYEDAGNHGHTLHRSFVRFDLSAVTAQLTHKTTVKSAAITWGVAPGSPQVCPGSVFGLDAALPGAESMFGDAFAAFPKHLLTDPGNPAAIIQTTQRWLLDPAQNYGTVVRAQNEGQTTENGQCVEFANNAVLKLDLEEQLHQ